MSTRKIPTDKHGRVYYGPRTCKEADKMIGALRGYSYAVTDREGEERKVIERLKAAGYTGVAARTAKSWGIAL